MQRISRPQFCSLFDDGSRREASIIAQNDIWLDNAIRADFDTAPDSGGAINDGGRMNRHDKDPDIVFFFSAK